MSPAQVLDSKKSLVRMLSWHLIVMLVIAACAALGALITLSQSYSDARAINVSGSLRMQNYRLAFAITQQVPPDELSEYIRQFEASLTEPALAGLIDRLTTNKLGVKYHAIVDRWHNLKPNLLSENAQHQYISEVKEYVNDIDQLVFLLQQHLEVKVNSLFIYETVCLLLLIFSSWLTIRMLRFRVNQPLDTLVSAASQLEAGQFDIHLPMQSTYEFSMLSKAFNRMAGELKKLYSDLEAKVQEQTQALTQANAELGFLYHCSDTVHVSHFSQSQLNQLMEELRKQLHLHTITLSLAEETNLGFSSETYQHTSDEIVHTHARKTISLEFGGQRMGTLMVSGPYPLSQTSSRLLSNFCQLIAKAFHVEMLLRQEQQLLLQEERGIIARELHDSLAQSLSYLKIQLTLLKHSCRKGCMNHTSRETIEELSSGLDGAYRQLRELLSTFRLSSKESDLNTALHGLIEQLKQQSGPDIQLQYALTRQPLPPHQHIHLLQIIREAVLNAIKHAKCTLIQITCLPLEEGMIRVSIEDNGSGINNDRKKLHHYGLEIMKERAESLQGQLSIGSLSSGGTQVCLVFPENNIQQQA